MKYLAHFTTDKETLDWVFDADSWTEAMKKAVEKQKAIGIPLRTIERIKENA